MLKTAEEAGREFNTDEDREYRKLERRAGDLACIAEELKRERDRRLDEACERAHAEDGRNGVELWTDQRTGQIIRALPPSVSLRSIVGAGDTGRSWGSGEPLSFGRCIRGLVTGNWEGAEAEHRALAEGAVGTGGYMVPAYLSAEVIDAARAQSVVFRAGARTIPMASRTLRIARLAGDITPAWHSENAAETSSDPTFEAVDLSAQTLVAIMRGSVELFEDAPNIDAVLRNSLAQSLALELDRVALMGTGTPPEPRGVEATTDVQKINTVGALASYDPFSTAVQNIRTENGEPNAIIWHPRTAGECDRLKDSTDQPMAQPPSVAALAKFSTSQIPINAGTGTNESDAYVGVWSELLIGMRTELMIEATRFADTGFLNLQVLVRAYLRADVGVAHPKHFCELTGILPPSP